MSSIQKRTKKVRDTIQREWQKRWWQFILDNQDKSWDWSMISSNPNLTMKDITERPDKDWNWDCISRNKNITMEFIINNPDKPWNWETISKNKFEKDKELFIEEAYKKHLAAYKIQNWWKHITMSPYYAIGRKFIDRDGLALLNEYNEMTK